MIDPKKIEEWKRLAEEATQGPWKTSRRASYVLTDARAPGGEAELQDRHGEFYRREDAEFIAAAREAVPALIAEVERLSVLVDQRDEIADELDDAHTLLDEVRDHVVAWSTVEGVPPMPSALVALLGRIAVMLGDSNGTPGN